MSHSTSRTLRFILPASSLNIRSQRSYGRDSRHPASVLMFYAKKYKEAPLDRSGYVSIYFNTRLRDALYDSSH